MIQDGGLIAEVGGSLTKIGTGTHILSGANIYAGDTTISAGTLEMKGSTNLRQRCRAAQRSAVAVTVRGCASKRSAENRDWIIPAIFVPGCGGCEPMARATKGVAGPEVAPLRESQVWGAAAAAPVGIQVTRCPLVAGSDTFFRHEPP